MRQKFPLLPRKKNTDKTSYGHTLVLAGSKSMTGAAVLTSRAALVSGSGLVTLGAPKSIFRRLSRFPLEAMRLELPETSEVTLAYGSYSKIIQFVQKRNISCVAIGPGLSQNTQTASLVRRGVGSLSVPVVLDADGLNSFQGRAEELKKHRGPLVLTPHAKEFERLFRQTLPAGLLERKKLAKRVSKFYDVVLVLKGPDTLVVDHDRVYQNTTGNPGMAKGGTGDVLTGIIASFISQGLEPFEAARWAVYFHGLAGDRVVQMKSELGLLASDLIEVLPKVFR